MEQIVSLSADSTAGHELEHAWRMSSGLSHDEDSAMFGNAQFSGQPYEALVLLFLSTINFDEYALKFSREDVADLTRLQLAAEKRGISYGSWSGSPDSWILRVKGAIRLGFNSNGDGVLVTHSQAVKELLISLALQYGVGGPYDDEGLAWVKTLFERIRTATSHPDVNDSLLRRRIALAYRERFGREFKPVTNLRPVLEVEFRD